jgi:hypothetical protein
VLYVDEHSPMPLPPYSDWITAAATIQDAVDVSRAGDLILVTNGVYQKGGRAVCGRVLNRVALTVPVTVQSVNGPSLTIIKGYQVPGVTNADSSARCAYLTNGAVLAGFTLSDGATRASGSPNIDQAGSGVWCESVGAVVSNCVVIGGRSHGLAGGVLRGTLKNCVVVGNSAVEKGGGVYEGALMNCVLMGNSSGDSGGGAYYSKLTNCTVVANSARVCGGGVDSSTLINCIVYYNRAPIQANWVMSVMSYCCTEPLPKGMCNITHAPLFVDLSAENLRLQSNSPCINSGYSTRRTTGVDLDGNPRVKGEVVDIGAYEFQSPTSVISYDWLQKYGLRTDGSADFADPDGDGYNNLREWRSGTNPTNALSLPRSPKTGKDAPGSAD